MANQRPYRELTLASTIAGVIVGAILNMGICYAGLQIGFTIVGSAVAAVIGFGILRGIGRGLLRRPGWGSILEVNVFQTVASSVNTVNAGIIFTVPVMFLLQMEDQIDLTALLLAAVAGSLLGVVMIIPLRKQIIEYERLRFPEGVAVAAILRSPGAGIRKSVLLVTGIAISGIVSALIKYWGPPDALDQTPFMAEHFNVGEMLGLPAGISMTFAVTLLSFGAGYLAGKPGLVVLYGTLLNYWILIPIAIGLGWVPDNFANFDLFSDDYKEAERFVGAYGRFTSRHVGIGMILGGAIAGIIVAMPALKAALASLKGGGGGGRREEVPAWTLGVGTIAGLALVFGAAQLSSPDDVSIVQILAVTAAGGLWLWLAGLVVAQTTGRTDWSPLSGLALIAIAIMMAILGTEADKIVPAVTIGAAICVATSMCADMMADLKTGYLVGGLPVKQQIAQIATCWIGPGIAVVTVFVLWKAYAFGPNQAEELYARQVEEAGLTAEYNAATESQSEETPTLDAFVSANARKFAGTPTDLPKGTPKLGAPQAGALEAAIEIVQSGDVPVWKYLAGAILGLVISLLVSPGLGVMVGLSMYLPFEYMIVFGLGGILSIVVTKLKGARFAEDNGVPIAAGLIVGDAVVGVAHAILKVGQSAL